MVVAILRHRPTIIHVNTSLNHRAFWRDFVHLCVSKLLGRKVVFQVHGGSLASYSKRGVAIRLAIRAATGLADAVVVITNAEYESFKQLGSGKVVLIPNGIDLSEYSRSGKKKQHLGSCRLLFIGRVHRDKGVLEAVEAMKILRDEYKMANVNLVIAGAGPAEDEVRGLVRRFKLEETATLLGPVYGRKKIDLFADADILVFPTYHGEGLPYVLLEGLASGTPAITTQAGGIPDVIEAGVHAQFVNPRDAAGVAKAIFSLCSDREALERMSAKCIERAEYYSIERVARQFGELYEAVAGKEPCASM